MEDINLELDGGFKALRHRFYRLGKHGPVLLVEMGILSAQIIGAGYMPTKDEIREALFEAVRLGRIKELEDKINVKEAELLVEVSHVGDPCVYCGVPGLSTGEPMPGPCPVRKKERKAAL